MPVAGSTTAFEESAERGRTLAGQPAELNVVRDYDSFLTLREEWEALASRLAQPSVFLRHAWADAAWAWRGQEGEPLVAVARREGKIIGIAPLLLQKAPPGKPELSWLSVPDTQEADLICAPDDREAVAGALADWLTTTDIRWSRLSLAPLPADSPSFPVLRAALEARGVPTMIRGAGVNGSIDLTPGWESFYRSRSRRLKKGNNLIANRLQRAGTVEVSRLTGEAITPEIQEIIRELSAESWKQITRVTFDQPGPGAFLDTLIEHGRAGDWLVVWLLTLDGDPLASELHLEHGGRAHALRADYTERAADLSPGSYLNWKIIERLFESGLSRYELGPGENPYKQRWTNDGLELAAIEAWPATSIGRLKALWHRRLRPGLAGLKSRWRRLVPG